MRRFQGSRSFEPWPLELYVAGQPGKMVSNFKASGCGGTHEASDREVGVLTRTKIAAAADIHDPLEWAYSGCHGAWRYNQYSLRKLQPNPATRASERFPVL